MGGFAGPGKKCNSKKLNSGCNHTLRCGILTSSDSERKDFIYVVKAEMKAKQDSETGEKCIPSKDCWPLTKPSKDKTYETVWLCSSMRLIASSLAAAGVAVAISN